MGSCASSKDIKNQKNSPQKSPKAKEDASLWTTATTGYAKQEPSSLGLTNKDNSGTPVQIISKKSLPVSKDQMDSVPQKLKINSVVLEMDLDSDQLDEKLSEMVQQLFDKYDKDDKGFLDLNQFQTIIKKHSSNTDAKASKILGVSEEEKDVMVHKWELYGILRQSARS